jgi:hypothetical protein
VTVATVPLCSVDAVWVHPRFTSGAVFTNDVAVLRVTQDMGIDPILLNPNAASEASGQSQTITGWGTMAGRDVAETFEPSDMLQKATLLAMRQSDCAAAYARVNYRVTTDMLCATASRGRDTCVGDGGGPMFVTTRDKRFYQTGVSSWGVGCPRDDAPGVFANVRLLSPWIKAVGGAGVGTPRGTPPHDNRRSPRTLTGFPTGFAASTRLATVQAGEPGFSVGATGDSTGERWDGTRWMHHTIWYAWRAPATGRFTVSTAGSAFDTVVNVFDLSRGTLMASNDDCGDSTGDGGADVTVSSCATFAGTSGRQYLLQFGGYGFGAMGDLKITLSRA